MDSRYIGNELQKLASKYDYLDGRLSAQQDHIDTQLGVIDKRLVALVTLLDFIDTRLGFIDKQLEILAGLLAIVIPTTAMYTWESVSDLSSWERWAGYGVYAWVMFKLFPIWRIFFTKKS